MLILIAALKLLLCAAMSCAWRSSARTERAHSSSCSKGPRAKCTHESCEDTLLRPSNTGPLGAAELGSCRAAMNAAS